MPGMNKSSTDRHTKGHATLLLITTSLLAATSSLANWHTIGSLATGFAISSDAGQSKTFPIINPVTDEFFVYSANHSTQTAGVIDAFVGGEWTLSPQFALQAGLGYNQAWNLHAKGSLLQGTDLPSADRWTWHYNILTRQLLAEGKLLYHYTNCYHPYVLFGLGAAFNQASDYNTNVPPFLTFTRQYNNNNAQTSFTYALGVGIDMDIQKHLRLGVGYRFADAGQVMLGHATIDTTSVSGTLSQSHFYINEILAQITYVS